MLKIGYVGGHWHTNIGNSFYNIGGLYLLKQIPNIETYFIADPPQENWINLKNDYDYISNLNLDLLIVTGPSFTENIVKQYKLIFDSFKKRNKQIAFLSIGAMNYTSHETEKVANFLKLYDIKFVTTRDRVTYNIYKDKINAPIYDGICTSMYLNDATSVPILNDRFHVFNFNKMSEPLISLNNNHDYIYKERHFYDNFQKDLNGLNIVRTSSEPYNKFYKLIYNRQKIYWSAAPDGYLSIYKSAETVFSDRVHTCCAALVLGTKSMYVQNSTRSKQKRHTLLNRLGADKIFDEPTLLNFDFIKLEKKKLYEFLLDTTQNNQSL